MLAWCEEKLSEMKEEDRDAWEYQMTEPLAWEINREPSKAEMQQSAAEFKAAMQSWNTE